MFRRVLLLSVVSSCIFASSVEAQLFRRRAARQRFAQSRVSSQPQQYQTQQYQPQQVQRPQYQQPQQLQLQTQQNYFPQQLQASQFTQPQRATVAQPFVQSPQPALTLPTFRNPATINASPRPTFQPQPQVVYQPYVAPRQNRTFSQPAPQAFSQPLTIGSVASQPQTFNQPLPATTIPSPGSTTIGQFDIARQPQTTSPVQQAGGDVVLNAPLPTAEPASLNAPLTTAPTIVQSPAVDDKVATTSLPEIGSATSEPAITAPATSATDTTTVELTGAQESKKSYSVLEKDN